MIIKYFCDCGKELVFTQEDSCVAPWCDCECGKQYYKTFCDDCGTVRVNKSYQETMEQHIFRWSAS